MRRRRSSAIGGAHAADRTVEPLNQYAVSGRVTTDQLARAGYDLNEVKAIGKTGKLGIVATPEQAQSLRDKGATVEPLAEARKMVAPPSPLTNPTHGYDVFRPWSLKPAPCPNRCTTPNVPLKKWYHDLASRYPEIVKERTIGTSVLGQPIKAYKITEGAGYTRDGAKPVTLYESTQHAREWISAEVNRRLFAWFIDHRRDRDVKRLLRTNEVWFIPMMNPDGYDYTFTAKGTRLWRKNLRDVNSDGVIDPANDGVDTNRNWPEKWNWDLEGASDDPASETYHGASPASEPEVQASRSLHQRLKPKFLIDYHSFAQLILYPEGWQVETEATDAPLMKALAGDDDRPAVPGFDPDVSAELYTTNGDVTGDAYNAWGTQAYTVELDGGSGDGVGGTVDGPDSFRPAASSSRTTRRPSRPSSRRTWTSRWTSRGPRPSPRSPSRTWATRRRTSCRRRSRSRTAIRRPSRSTPSARSATSRCSGRSTVGASSAAASASTPVASATASPAPTTTSSADRSAVLTRATP